MARVSRSLSISGRDEDAALALHMLETHGGSGAPLCCPELGLDAGIVPG
jgi:hypothetical protein